MPDAFAEFLPGLSSPAMASPEVVDVSGLTAEHVFALRPRFLWVEISGASGNLVYRAVEGGDLITKVLTSNAVLPIRVHSISETSTVSVVHGEGGADLS